MLVVSPSTCAINTQHQAQGAHYEPQHPPKATSDEHQRTTESPPVPCEMTKSYMPHKAKWNIQGPLRKPSDGRCRAQFTATWTPLQLQAGSVAERRSQHKGHQGTAVKRAPQRDGKGPATGRVSTARLVLAAINRGRKMKRGRAGREALANTRRRMSERSTLCTCILRMLPDWIDFSLTYRGSLPTRQRVFN